MMHTAPSTIDVLIAGAGPTGLFAALLLAHCGLKVRILDKHEQQAHESRAFALQPRSLELFAQIGIVDAFLARGMIASGIKIFVNGKQSAELNLSDIGVEDSPYAFLLMLPQADIEQILITELTKYGIVVEHNIALTAFTQDANGITVTATHIDGQTQTIQTAYLLGADGAHSTVRHILGLTFEGDAYPQNFMLTDCHIDWPLDHDFVKVFMRERFLGIYFPLHGENTGRIITINPDDHPDKTAQPPTLAEISAAFADDTGLPIKLSNPTWLARYRIHHRGVNHYREGRVFVAGDAAHIHSPVGAQGMNTGLQDVANLVWKLAVIIKGPGAEKLLETYHQERWPVGQKLLNFTDKLFKQVSASNHFKAKIRNFLVPRVTRFISHHQRIKHKLFNFVSQLGIRYHNNAFLWNEPNTHQTRTKIKLTAGHRAPNATYKRNHDIFSLISGYQFHVLALCKKSLNQATITEIAAELKTLPTHLGLPLQTHFITHTLLGETHACIQAESNQVFDHYDITDENPSGLFLIRPDGYIAYRANEIDIEKLKKFCLLFVPG